MHQHHRGMLITIWSRGKKSHLLQVLGVLPMDVDADLHYGDIRSELEAAGTPIGPNDLLIAAHARSLNLTLISANVEEFLRGSNNFSSRLNK